MTADNVLGADERPPFFAINDPGSNGLEAPEPRRDVAVRTFVRSLAGMQKEALVVSSGNQHGWRLVSDEGPYLAGHDEAPFPLAFLSAGMVASYGNEITALADQRAIAIDSQRLTLDNTYTMDGSAIRGTLVGGALPPRLDVSIASNADDATVRNLSADAVDASPLNGLLRGENVSLFTVTLNGRLVAPRNVAALGGTAEPDAIDRFARVCVDGPDDAEELMRKVASAPLLPNGGEARSSGRAGQKRQLRVRAVCTIGGDGMKTIDVQLRSPGASNFRFRSAERSDEGGGRAPDAATLISAGLGFCFMTQLGRYAAVTKRHLDRYRIIQDTHFSAGGASGGTGRAGEADPVETHVFLDTPEDEDFARTVLDMAEQTCFLHALCRTDLRTRLQISRRAPA